MVLPQLGKRGTGQSGPMWEKGVSKGGKKVKIGKSLRCRPASAAGERIKAATATV